MKTFHRQLVKQLIVTESAVAVKEKNIEETVC